LSPSAPVRDPAARVEGAARGEYQCVEAWYPPEASTFVAFRSEERNRCAAEEAAP
jgi:hypothetical protein